MTQHHAFQPTPVRDSEDTSSAVSICFSDARSLKRDLVAEFRAGLQSGVGIKPEDVASRWPAPARDDRDFASVLFEDYQHRVRRGDRPSLDEYSVHFPACESELAHLVSRQQVMASLGASSFGPTLGLPNVGDHVFGFRLRAELGQGAFARVFLAEQDNLAGRPVVLKISGVEGDEPYTLAQLQHTNVVSIYSVHEDARAGLRALCMPYFGGASLSHVLKYLWAESSAPARGEQYVASLKAVEAPSPETVRPAGQFKIADPPASDAGAESSRALPRSSASAGPDTLTHLGNLTYAQVCAWVVARLAEGLQHAHQRGILHRDIKPSNVLIGSDATPMLLDFNLAENHDAGQAQAEATMGGTVAYMAPEHLRALASPSAATVRLVDHRSDVYSLGMVLFEMLTGHSPFDQTASYSFVPVVIEAMAVERSQTIPSARAMQPWVPWSLESVVRKCLAPEPADRYQSADELAEDLRRILTDQPLRFAPELSRRERIVKWARRHPRLASSASVATVAAMLLAGCGAALAGMRHHLADAREEITANQDRERRRAYVAGTEHALCLINTVTDLQDNERLGLEICEQTLDLYNVRVDANWQDDPRWQRLGASDRRQLGEDTRELLLLLAWGRVHRGPKDSAVLRDALALLDRAEAIRDLQPSKAVWNDRAQYLRELDESGPAREAQAHADQLQAASARDHYLLATSYARKGDATNLTRAISELSEAIRLEPRHYWSWVQRGICYQELGDFALAAADFGTCIGQWPEFAWGHFNKGYVLSKCGKHAEAARAYSDALARDPDFLMAYVNRGLARLELQQNREALADFDHALAHGRDDAFLHSGRGIALERLGQFKEADAAFGRAFKHEQATNATVRQRLLWAYGFAVSERHPDKARAAFDEVLRQDPNHVQALYGRAMLAVNDGHLQKAIEFFNRALDTHPGFIDARRYRGVLWARQARFDLAMQDINWCLEQEPRGSQTLYAAACVAALAADKTGDNGAAEQALDFLQKALAAGHSPAKVASDPDLAAIRKSPRFAAVIAYARPVSSQHSGQ